MTAVKIDSKLSTAADSALEPHRQTLYDQQGKRVAGQLHAIEAARLRTALSHWGEYTRRVRSRRGELTHTQLLQELDTVTDGLAAALSAVGEPE